MVRILVKNEEQYIMCNVEGLKFTTRISDEKCQYENTLKSPEHFQLLMEEIHDLYDSFDNKSEGFDMVCEYMNTADFHDKYFDGMGRIRFDHRNEEEISAYIAEAFDKVWLMRSYDIANRRPAHERSREGAERILKTYNDIPRDGYDTWECGYWNGILAALRWVTGEEKDSLDT